MYNLVLMAHRQGIRIGMKAIVDTTPKMTIHLQKNKKGRDFAEKIKIIIFDENALIVWL